MNEAESTVFVVDDDADLRESLGWLFESAGLRFKSYSTAQGFLTDYKPEEPGCKTVEIHRGRVIEKMQVESVAELVRLDLLCS
jgi:FixJ family two-component response regulator